MHIHDIILSLSQWTSNPWPYFYYRALVAFYFVFMVFYTALVGTLKSKMLIMLTYWSFYILTACQVLRAANVWHYIQLKKLNHGSYQFCKEIFFVIQYVELDLHNYTHVYYRSEFS